MDNPILDEFKKNISLLDYFLKYSLEDKAKDSSNYNKVKILNIGISKNRNETSKENDNK